MQKTAWALFGVAVGFLIVGSGVGMRWFSGTTHATSQDAADEVRSLRAETERLQRAVAALEHSKHAEPKAAPRAPNELSPELVARLRDMAAQQARAEADVAARPTPEQEQASALQYATYLDDELERPARGDAAAASSLRNDVAAFLDAESGVLDVQCSKELCRLKMRHKDGETYRKFQSRAFQQDKRLWSGPMTFVVLEEPEEGPLVVAAYLGRSQALPSPEPTR